MKAGTVVTCPECSIEQFKTTKDLLPGMQMKDAGFESLGFDLESQRAGCFRCANKFVRAHPMTGKTQVHTRDDGWVSLDKTQPKAGVLRKSALLE